LQAEVLELKSTSKGFSRGVVIESKVRRGQGTMGTVLVQRGMMKIGDYFVCGVTHGRVRSMFNEYGKAKKEAGPSIPVEISGWSDQPEVGEQFITLEDERTARQIAEERTQQQKEKNVGKQQKMQLENVFSQLDEQDQVEIRLLIKADVQGSAEALQSSLEQLGNDKISVNVIHSGVGNITTTDITLASASDAIVIAFNVQVDAKAKQLRSQEGVDVRNYDIIYNALDDVKAAMEGLLEPEIREEVVGRLEVRQVFNSAKNGMVFGGLVTEGRLLRNDLARVLRNGDNLYEGTIISLKRFKDDVREVTNNHECGLVMDFPEIQEGDVVVAYQQVEEKATL
ncbi:MAG: translation initiation factor IF-2, partial [SAR324 cluster bacterium]|nr:translation initiation factor IF-2 [SAR324 cluster bacterium]